MAQVQCVLGAFLALGLSLFPEPHVCASGWSPICRGQPNLILPGRGAWVLKTFFLAGSTLRELFFSRFFSLHLMI